MKAPKKRSANRKPYRPAVYACLDCGQVQQLVKNERYRAARLYCTRCGGTIVEPRFHHDEETRRRAYALRQSLTSDRPKTKSHTRPPSGGDLGAFLFAGIGLRELPR